MRQSLTNIRRLKTLLWTILVFAGHYCTFNNIFLSLSGAVLYSWDQRLFIWRPGDSHTLFLCKNMVKLLFSLVKLARDMIYLADWFCLSKLQTDRIRNTKTVCCAKHKTTVSVTSCATKVSIFGENITLFKTRTIWSWPKNVTFWKLNLLVYFFM